MVDEDIATSEATGVNSASPGTPTGKTTMAAPTWSPQTSGAQASINDLYFHSNRDTGWAGRLESVLKNQGRRGLDPIARANREFYYSVFFLKPPGGWRKNNTCQATSTAVALDASGPYDCCDAANIVFKSGSPGRTRDTRSDQYLAIDLGVINSWGLILKDHGTAAEAPGIAAERDSEYTELRSDSGVGHRWAGLGDSGVVRHTKMGESAWKRQRADLEKPCARLFQGHGTQEG